MRYGLSLLVCLALTVAAQAQNCPNGKCPYVREVVSHPVKTVVHTVAAAPCNVAHAVVAAPCCGSQNRVTTCTQQVGPIRSVLRSVFRR